MLSATVPMAAGVRITASPPPSSARIPPHRPPNVRELPDVASFETLAQRLPMTPAQRNSLLEAEAIAARRRVAVASAKPDVTVSLGVRRLHRMDAPVISQESMALRLQMLPSRNGPWQDTRMTGLVRTSLGASEDVPRTFWALFGLRTVRYRLLGPERSVLASTLRGEKAPPAEEIYSVRMPTNPTHPVGARGGSSARGNRLRHWLWWVTPGEERPR